MRTWLRTIVGAAAVCILGYSLYQVYGYVMEAQASSSLNDQLAESVVYVEEPQTSLLPKGQPAQPEEERDEKNPPIRVDFDRLHQQNSDIIAWIYCEDTKLNYPIVQAADNDYYLRRLLDGSYNIGGTLFADCTNAADFSDWNTLVYGHNMKNGTMFGTLPKYKDPACYKEHPVMWLLTPEQDYKVELLAGCVTDAFSSLYTVPATQEEALALAQTGASQSTFTADVTAELGDRLLTLSTCSYEFEDARYVLMGRLVPVSSFSSYQEKEQQSSNQKAKN